MKIIKAKTAGFCFGVDRAVKLTYGLLEQGVRVASQFALAPIFVFGQQFGWPEAILQSMLYAGFSAFVFVTSLVARQQSLAREEFARHAAQHKFHGSRAPIAPDDEHVSALLEGEVL